MPDRKNEENVRKARADGKSENIRFYLARMLIPDLADILAPGAHYA
jgi:hypothetical protein